MPRSTKPLATEVVQTQHARRSRSRAFQAAERGCRALVATIGELDCLHVPSSRFLHAQRVSALSERLTARSTSSDSLQGHVCDRSEARHCGSRSSSESALPSQGASTTALRISARTSRSPPISHVPRSVSGSVRLSRPRSSHDRHCRRDGSPRARTRSRSCLLARDLSTRTLREPRHSRCVRHRRRETLATPRVAVRLYVKRRPIKPRLCGGPGSMCTVRM